MKMRNIFILLFVCASLAGAAGCSRNAASIDEQEERHPLMQRALNHKRMQDIDKAIELFEKIIGENPDMARAHLELGLLYDSVKEDYMRALYHYQRYLELRPNTEKREMIENIMKMARLSFAATLPHSASDTLDEIAALKRENAMLNTRINELTQALNLAEKKAAEAVQREEAALLARVPDAPGPVAHERPPDVKPDRPPVVKPDLPPKPAPVKAAPSVTPRAPAKASPVVIARPEPLPAKPAVETYRVLRGDTLSSIASKVYQDPAMWTKIFDANRDKLDRPEGIRVGQVLVIP
ncbi:MAG: LysM peptidoglycan-binding domain-containing protein [Kiritimatiellia bacterium]